MEVKDRISGLPLDILAHILGLLRIEEAAKSAILCTSLRDAWLSLSHLNFDSHFFKYIQDHYIAESSQSPMSVIDTIIIKHNGPIRKFVFDCNLIRLPLPYCRWELLRHWGNDNDDCNFIRPRKDKSRWLDFDEWLHCLTQSGVEEMHLSFGQHTAYILPDCIYSCPSLKTLHLSGVCFEQVSTACIFLNVTTLLLENIQFDHRKCSAAELPMLRNLTCESISGFNFTAPKLRSLRFRACEYYIVGRNSCLILPVTLDLRTIHSVHLETIDLERFVSELTWAGQEQTTLNVEHLQLRLYDKYSDNISTCFHLLRMCPLLIKLDIHLTFGAGVASAEELLELPEHTLAQTFDTIRDLSIVCWFQGSDPEMLFFKWLLCRFPALEKVLFYPNYMYSGHNPCEDMETLLCFLRFDREVEISYSVLY
ncbi:unnamed protein product [Cuscuta europaea]|nr:unnamed protein product [Cuscuta europaea]CAH9113390.1 unnamed protein product [Cuscuta europaea]